MGRKRTFDYDEARRLRAEGWSLQAIADRVGTQRFRISKVCLDVVCPINHKRQQSESARNKFARERKAEAIRLRLIGMKSAEIAEVVGLSVSRVDQVTRAALRERREAQAAIPKWLPPFLEKTFRTVAGRRGEEFAASHCRRLKAEAAASCR